jgi:hypothetical protein
MPSSYDKFETLQNSKLFIVEPNHNNNECYSSYINFNIEVTCPK